MAQGFEAYHVPQQSRRDKLRVLSHQHSPSHLLHYDPSLLPPPPADLFGYPSSSDRLVKEEPPSNLLRFVGDSRHHLYAPSDPQPSLLANPSSIQEDNQAFLCASLGNVGPPGHPSYYGSVDSAVSGCDGDIISSNARGLSLSLWSRENSHGGGRGDDQGNVPLPLPLPPHPPLELNLERYGSALAYRDRGSRCFGEVTIGPLGPFMGYSSVLRGSRFLKPAQQLLEELCNAGMGIFAPERVSESDSSLMEGGGEGFGDVDEHCGVGGENKSRLKSMLDEVCRRYKQYYQQLQNAVASFECIDGIRNAAPYVNLALKVMSKHFRCLKDAIMDQFQFSIKAMRNTRVDIPRFETDERPHLGQRGIRNSGFLEHQPVWRPQRGLPERAVAVLRAWLFDHFLHPYPTDNDKLMLARETGLLRSQVSNWFVNARVRLWKPMVEEIHMLEAQQMQMSQTQQRDERNVATTSNDQFPLSNSVPLTSTPRLNDTQTHHLSHVVGENIISARTSTVTLTLGLQRQNNSGMNTSAVVPAGAVQQTLGLGLETNREEHELGGGYGSQELHFERDARGGKRQLLRNFSG